jgi:hypothetical protein
MKDRDLRASILEYVRAYHRKHGTPPSMGAIVRRFRLSKYKIYNKGAGLFPGGKEEICRAAGVPFHPEMKEQTRRAREALAKKRERDQESPEANEAMKDSAWTMPTRLTKQMLGISVLEGGKDLELIQQGLIDLYVKLKKRHGLSIAKIGRLIQYLDKAAERELDDPDRLLNLQDWLIKAGFLQLTTFETKRLAPFLKEAAGHGWEPKQLVNYLTRLWNAGVMRFLTPSEAKLLAQLSREAEARNWTLKALANYLAEHGKTIAKLQAQTEGWKRYRSQLEARAREMEETIRQYEEKGRRITEEITRAQQVLRIKEENEKLKERVKALEEERKKIRETLKTALDERDALKAQHQKATEERDAALATLGLYKIRYNLGLSPYNTSFDDLDPDQVKNVAKEIEATLQGGKLEGILKRETECALAHLRRKVLPPADVGLLLLQTGAKVATTIADTLVGNCLRCGGSGEIISRVPCPQCHGSGKARSL